MPIDVNSPLWAVLVWGCSRGLDKNHTHASGSSARSARAIERHCYPHRSLCLDRKAVAPSRQRVAEGSARDGLYIVSTYEEIRSLLFHPKASLHGVSRPRFPRTGNLFTDWIMNPI